MFEKQIGIDLGTVNVLVHVKGRGIVLHEPSVVAIRRQANKMVLIGHEAYDMMGRTPESIEVVRPMRDGVIADFVVTEAMLRQFIQDIVGRFPLFKPKVMISTPRGVTSVEERAVHDAAMQAGAGAAYLIPEPLAAAYGAGLPMGRDRQYGRRHGRRPPKLPSSRCMILSFGTVCASAVTASMSRSSSYIRKKYNLNVGDQTAEEIKIAIGSALPTEEDAVSRFAVAIRSTAAENDRGHQQRDARGDDRAAAEYGSYSARDA